MQIRAIVNELERHAPRGLAMDWDNVGLLLGEAGQNVERVLVSLDITHAAVEKAVRTGCGLIVSHHPLFLKPLARINDPRILRMARHGIAAYCAHTNLDVATDGVNHALARALGLGNLELLSHESGAQSLHVAVYVPQQAAEAVAEAVHAAGAGIIGAYSHCLNRYPVEGQFLPEDDARPAEGEVGRLEHVHEQKLEFFTDTARLPGVLAAMRGAHPYETPAYAVFPLRQADPNYGLGLVGELEQPLPLNSFASMVKKRLSTPAVQLWPASEAADKPVKRVAVCGGSGGTLTGAARSAGADVFVLGESNYHGMLDSPLPLVLAGHFHTEQPVLETLAGRLTSLGLDVERLTTQEHEISGLIVV